MKQAPMRVTFLAPPDNLSGGIRVVATYARELQKRGHVVTIVMAKPNTRSVRQRLRLLKHGELQAAMQREEPAIEGHLSGAGVPILELDKHDIQQGTAVPDADVVIATWWETVQWLQQLPQRKGKRFHLVQDYEIWFDEQTNEQVKAGLRADTVKIAISQALKRQIEDELGIRGVHVVGNGIDLSLFRAPQRALNDTPQVGYIYSTTPRKALERYKQIVDATRKRMPNLRVLAFGAQAPHAAFPLPHGADYINSPAQPLIPELYARCDVWLFASRVDSFGLPVLEAMASRTPVVSLPVGAAPELLQSGAGIIVQPETEAVLPERFAHAVELICQDPMKWRQRSDLAYQKAQLMGWDSSVDQFEQLLLSAKNAG